MSRIFPPVARALWRNLVHSALEHHTICFATTDSNNTSIGTYPNGNGTPTTLLFLHRMAFQKNRYRSAADANTFAARYRAHMAKHPFLLFGLPFMAVIIGGSFVLTPATAIRYERHDRKVRMVSREDELGIGKAGRRVNMREEYNVSGPGVKALLHRTIYDGGHDN